MSRVGRGESTARRANMREVIAGRTRLVELLVPCLEAAVARGVDAQATLPDPEGAKPKKAQAIADVAALLKQAGVRVSFREACPNLVIADSATVWYGGIAPFAYPRPDEQVLRFISGEVARELERLGRGRAVDDGDAESVG